MDTQSGINAKRKLVSQSMVSEAGKLRHGALLPVSSVFGKVRLRLSVTRPATSEVGRALFCLSVHQSESDDYVAREVDYTSVPGKDKLFFYAHTYRNAHVTC